MREYNLNAVLISATMVLMSGAQNAHAIDRNSIVVSARAQTPQIVAGRDAWYEITIKNVAEMDQIVDLSYVVVAGTNFITPQGSKGTGFNTSDINVLAPKCVEWSAFSVIKPGASITVLSKIATPFTIHGTTLVQLQFELMRVVDLTNCRKEVIHVEAKLEIQVQAA
jgi:hypothetical protein